MNTPANSTWVESKTHNISPNTLSSQITDNLKYWGLLIVESFKSVLVVEKAKASKCHCHVVLVAGFDYVVVTD